MKGLRKAALGLAVVACLLTAAPAAQAGAMDSPLVFTSQGAWITGWLARLAGWFGWGDVEQPRAVTAAAKTGRFAPQPTPQGDCHGGLDPSGTPCRP